MHPVRIAHLRAPVALSIAVLLASGIIGCSSTSPRGDKDAVKVAVKITKNLERGQKLMDDARADWNLNDPSENLDGLSKLIQAEELFFEARKLSPNSSKPRMALGNCRALIGYVYYGQYQKFEAEVKAAEEAGSEVSPKEIKSRDENLAKSRDWLQRSNQELEFYVRFLIQQFPNPFIYEALATNYEFLGEYGAAENMLKAFLQSVDISRERRMEFEARARALRKKRLDEFEG